MKIKLLSCSLVLASAAVLSGCSVPKNVAYFQDTETSAILAAANPQPITIKPDDKINIIVKTKDPAISDPLQSSPSIPPVSGSRPASRSTVLERASAHIQLLDRKESHITLWILKAISTFLYSAKYM